MQQQQTFPTRPRRLLTVLVIFLTATLDPATCDIEFLTVPEIIERRGYPVEVHRVITEDGYILELHRIPGHRDGPPVLVMHGLLDSSATWVINPGRPLGFMLADYGYDVWLGNNRGNTYSRHHVYLNPKGRDFWQFTADSYARYDNPAMIDYILGTTGHTDLYYIGHSSSTWSFWAMMNYHPSYNERIRLMTALGPVATMKYWRSIARLAVPFRNILAKAGDKLGIYETLPNKRLYGYLGKLFCSEYSITVPLCALGLFLLAGWDPKQLDKRLLPTIFQHVPAGGGSKVVQQFAQHVASGRFQRFDFGAAGNHYVYGQRWPPQYYPEMVTAPVLLLWGINDKMADKRDVALLAARLPNLVASQPIRWKLWQHLDFLWGKDADLLVYREIIRYLRHFDTHGSPSEYRSSDTLHRAGLGVKVDSEAHRTDTGLGRTSAARDCADTEDTGAGWADRRADKAADVADTAIERTNTTTCRADTGDG